MEDVVWAFSRMGLETGTFSGWVSERHRWGGSSAAPDVTPSDKSAIIATPGFDPIATTLQVPLFGSKAADNPGSGNYAGIKNPAIDAMVAKLTVAENQEEFLAACRTLDRVIAHGHYLIPAWTSRSRRIAYSDWKLERPKTIPTYPPEGVSYMDWFMLTWWARNPPKTSR